MLQKAWKRANQRWVIPLFCWTLANPEHLLLLFQLAHRCAPDPQMLEDLHAPGIQGTEVWCALLEAENR